MLVYFQFKSVHSGFPFSVALWQKLQMRPFNPSSVAECSQLTHGGRRGDLKEQDPVQWRGVSILQEKWCKASWASKKKDIKQSIAYEHYNPSEFHRGICMSDKLIISCHFLLQIFPSTPQKKGKEKKKCLNAQWNLKPCGSAAVSAPSALFFSPLTMWSCWTISSQ